MDCLIGAGERRSAESRPRSTNHFGRQQQDDAAERCKAALVEGLIDCTILAGFLHSDPPVYVQKKYISKGPWLTGEGMSVEVHGSSSSCRGF
jgi:hypothetical protein